MEAIPAVPDCADELAGDIAALAERQIHDEPSRFLGVCSIVAIEQLMRRYGLSGAGIFGRRVHCFRHA